MTKPAQEGGKNQVELTYRRLSQPSNGPDAWIGRDVLNKERSLPEERDLNRNLVLRAAKAGCVWNDGH